jgi:hypothetical protein
LIEFLPYSQKYIFKLYPKVGIVEEINWSDEEMEFNVRIKNMNGETEAMFHPSVSYYGNSLGYEFIIYLLE